MTPQQILCFMAQKNNKKEVVIVRFSALGDVALCIPVLYTACESNPHTQFTFVTRQAFTQILINRPANLNVVGIDLKNDYKGIGGMVRLAGELGKPSLFIDLHSVLRTRVLALMMRLKGVRVLSIDKGRKYKRQLVKNGAMTMTPLKPVLLRYAQPFYDASFNLDKRFSGLYADAPADVNLFATVSLPKQPGERWLGVAPFAAHAGKIYPIEKMQKVVETLAALPDAKIFLFGGGALETQTLTEWAYNHDNVVCVAGKNLGFAGELALMHYIDLMVCMDSGNMHLAAIAGARTLSIWGATHPAAGFAAWRSTKDDRIEAVLDCRPCSIFGNKKCRFGTFACMNTIKPQQIIEQINTIISQ